MVLTDQKGIPSVLARADSYQVVHCNRRGRSASPMCVLGWFSLGLVYVLGLEEWSDARQEIIRRGRSASPMCAATVCCGVFI